MNTERRTVTEAEWRAEGRKRFGEDTNAWRFVCPACGHVASVSDWKAAGAPPGTIGFSCVGRYGGAKREAFGEGPGPCDYAGFGLFLLNPVTVADDIDSTRTASYFEFAPEAS